MASANLRGAALGLVAMGSYATHDMVIKILGGRYAPVQTLFFVALLSLPVLVIVAAGRSDNGLRAANPGWVAGRTACITVGLLGGMTAFSTLPLAQVYAILFSMPLLITALSVPMLGERVGAHRWIAVLVGLLGVLIVLRPGGTELSAGHLGALLAALGGAIAAVIARKLAGREETLVMVVWPVLLNLAVSALALPFLYQPMPGADLGLAALIALFGLIGAALNVAAYRVGEAAIVAPMQYSQILWATVYGWLVFAETLDGATMLGLSVIVASGLYILWREARQSESARPVIESDRAGDALPSPSLGGFRKLLRLW